MYRLTESGYEPERAPQSLAWLRSLGFGGGLLLRLLGRACVDRRRARRGAGRALARPGGPGRPARRPPALRLDPVLLAEQRQHDLRLLLAEAGQLADPLQQLLAVLDPGP